MSERPKSALIVGSGGREHAFAQSLGEDVSIFVAPGNAGTEMMPNVKNIPISGPDLTTFAKDEGIDLTIIGPEAPLVEGLADDFRAHHLDVVGPNQSAAKLESSKSFATDFMAEYHIPHPKSWFVKSVEEYLEHKFNAQNIVIKADGLAGGKGVVLPNDDIEALATIRAMFDGAYDGAGVDGIQIQERLSGPEVSAFVLSDGTNFTVLPFAQDHKRLNDGDLGPNTGGMGAYSPVPGFIVSPDQEEKIRDIAQKTIDGMRASGNEYKGILYIGTMLAEQRGGDPVVIEYNARFGDPEAQSILTLMQRAGTDVFSLLQSTDQELRPELYDKAAVMSRAALTICLAAEGYPKAPVKGAVISGLGIKGLNNVAVHHGGTKLENGHIVVSGGRVLYVTGIGDTIDHAAEEAYWPASFINFQGRQMRRDIGHQARGVNNAKNY
jgi:phosphoribosylamine--glycine ligase